MGNLNLTMLRDQKDTSVCPLRFVQHLRLLWSHRRTCPRWLRLDHHYHRLLWSHIGEPAQVGSGWITTDPSDNTGELVQPSWPRLDHHRPLWSHTRELPKLAQIGPPQTPLVIQLSLGSPHAPCLARSSFKIDLSLLFIVPYTTLSCPHWRKNIKRIIHLTYFGVCKAFLKYPFSPLIPERTLLTEKLRHLLHLWMYKAQQSWTRSRAHSVCLPFRNYKNVLVDLIIKQKTEWFESEMSLHACSLKTCPSDDCTILRGCGTCRR